MIVPLTLDLCLLNTEFASLTTAQLLEKVRGLQNLAYQLGMEEGMIILSHNQYMYSVVVPYFKAQLR